MKNDINILKLSQNLTVKEKTKLMALDLDQKLVTGKGSLTDEELSALKTFERTKELGEYDFLMSLREFGAFAVSQAIEICMYKFMVFFHLISNFSDKGKEIDELKATLRDIYNEAYTYKEITDKLTEIFDFPVLGEFYEEKIQGYFETIEVFNELIGMSVFAHSDEVAQEGWDKKPFIEQVTLNNEMLEIIETFKKNGRIYYNGL
jgi:hypothetical protein